MQKPLGLTKPRGSNYVSHSDGPETNEEAFERFRDTQILQEFACGIKR
jgi:hypothetical protein